VAQDAQLLLKVGLDLSTFRNQLNTIGTQLGGQRLGIGIEFNKKTIADQYRILDKYIGRKEFTITLKSNLESEIKAADRLVQALQRVQQAAQATKGGLPVGTSALGLKKPTGGLSAAEIKTLFNAAIQGGLLDEKTLGKTRAQMVTALGSIGRDAMAGLLNGLESGNADLKKAAEMIGVTLIATVKSILGIASPSKEFENIGKNVGEGFEKGALSSMDNAFDALENKVRQRGKILDTLARGIFRMLGMDPAAMLEQARRQRMPPAISWPAVAGSAQRPPVGPSSTGRLLAGAAPLLSIGASRPAAGLLPSVTRQSELTTGLEALMQALSAQSQGAGMGGPAGAIVSMESGFITAMRERFAKAAERYLFGVETQIVDLFDAAVRQVEVAVDQYIGRIQGQISQRARQSVSVVDLGAAVQRLLPEAPSKKSPLMLPAAGETTATRRVRVTTGEFTGKGYVPEGGFPSDTMLGGRQGPATFIGPGSSMEKFKTALDIATASSRNFRASQIPLVSGLKEITEEFGFAIKQVLLFGTAYKGLAFVTSLPGQILNAAKSQQQYNNALQTATQDTGTFAKELLYVDNVQRAFGLNLETTRTGFTRLYASMAPADFDSGSIEKLFTGISAATAALQLTPDKAERVIYAFGQMASKGQIMSEELKGQLGDVLPGALAIFAKAAGMSVKEFSKAMEDGVFVGGKFREVFAKVSDELMTRFGTGAQAAGKSLQGLLNTVGGDFQRTLESFAPLANAAAQAILGPLSVVLKEISVAAQLAMGEQDRVAEQLRAAQKDLSSLRTGGADEKDIRAAEQNVAALAARYETLNEAMRDPAIAKRSKDIQQFIAEVTKASSAVMNFAGNISSILGPIFVSFGTNLSNIINTLAILGFSFAAIRASAMVAMGTLATMNAVVQAGQSISTVAAARATLLAGALKLVGVSATGAQIATIGFGTAVKALLASTGIGLLVVALGSVAAAFMSMGNAAKSAADKAKQSIDSMTDAARTGNVAMVQMQLSVAKAERQDLENLIKSVETARTKKGARQAEMVTLTEAQRKEIANLGIDATGSIAKSTLLNLLSELRAPLAKTVAEGEQKLVKAEARAKRLGLNKPTPGALPADVEEDKNAERRRREAEKLANQQQQLAMDAANRQNALDKARFEHLISMSENDFNHWKSLQDAKVEYELAGMNSIEARQRKHQNDLRKIELDRIEAIRKASEKSQQATMEFTAAKRTAAAAGGGSVSRGKLPSGITQYITGDPSSPFYRKDHGGSNYHEHLAFASRALAEAAYNQLTKAGIKVTEFQGRGPVGRHAPGSAHYSGMAFDVPGAQVPVGRERDLTAKVQSVLGFGQRGAAYTRQRRTERAGGKLEVEQQQLLNQTMQAGLAVRQATVEAIERTRAAIAQNISTIFPVAEQKLENDLLALRNQLQLQGMPDEYIRMKEQSYKADQEGARALGYYNSKLVELQKLIKPLQEKKDKKIAFSPEEAKNFEDLTKQIGVYSDAVAVLPGAQRAFNEELTRTYNLSIAAQAPLNQISAAYATTKRNLEELKNWGYQAVEAGKAIGSAFGTAFKDMISGSASAQEALAGMMQSIADHFLDMAAQIIAQQITMMIYGVILKALGVMGSFASAGQGLSGTGALTPGVGSNLPTSYAGVTGATGGLGSMGGGGGFGSFASFGVAPFANGGMVTGPTLGLIGEGKYNEAIVPLPDGRSIPVQLQDSSIRDKMGSDMAGAGAMPMLSMSFQSTTINGVEYVDRAQLEAAMAETRRISVREGATRGATIALDKLANSPSSRRRVGLR